jgi:CBS domain containing-hemolysin-like protein
VFDGLSLLDAVWERLGLDVEDSTEVNTLGGFVTERLGRIPRVGDRTTLERLRAPGVGNEGPRG